MSKPSLSSSERRSFLTRLNAGLASFGAMTGIAMAQGKASISTVRWEPVRHEKDDWLDKVPGKHRLVFDTTTPDGLGDALLFANNFFRANKGEYGLDSSDLAVVIIARHRSTPFGYNDAMWAKYGKTFATRSKVEDPKTKLAPKVNIYNDASFGESLRNRANTLDSLSKVGVQFGVCAFATRAASRAIAEAEKGDADAIFSELTANLVNNARMVPAGIVAVNRAQERGYSLVSA
jgi:intracellular sulfur oxidation DsrE/DsrF family protein